MGLMDRLRTAFGRGDGAPARQGRTGFSGRAYEGGRVDIKEFGSWQSSIGHPDSEYNGSRDQVVARLRDLDRNHPVVSGGMDRRVEAVVGPKLRLELLPNYEAMGRTPDWAYEWATSTEARWKSFAYDPMMMIDATQHSTFGGIVETAYRDYMQGEACAQIVRIKRGGKYQTAVKLIDPDRLSNPDNMADGMPLANGNKVFGGVEIDANGAAIAYHIRIAHPDLPMGAPDSFRWERVQRWGRTGRPKFIHAYKRNRAEQRRGVGKLASALKQIRMSDRYDSAELEAAILNAVMAISVESELPNEDVQASLAPTGDDPVPYWQQLAAYREQNKLTIPGVMVRHTIPGEKTNMLAREHPHGDYPAFQATMLRKIAGAMGISYEQLSQDWSTINYSSARTLLNEIWRGLLHDRWFFTQAFCTPIFMAWLEEAVALGTVKVPGRPANFYKWRSELCQCEWKGPGRGTIDPLKESQADDYALNQGTISEWEIADDRGQDYAQTIASRARAEKEREKWGFAPFAPLKAGAGRPSDGAEEGAAGDNQGPDGKFAPKPGPKNEDATGADE